MTVEKVITEGVLHNRQAEEAVIGSVLIDPNALYDLSFLKSRHFVIHRLRWIWEAFHAMADRDIEIDILTLTNELDRSGKLQEIGGAAFLTSLVDNIPTSANAVHYGRIVEDNAIRRDLLNAANDMATSAYNLKTDVHDALTFARLALEGIEEPNEARNFVSLGDLFSKVYEDVEARSKAPKEVWGYATGLPKLDKKTGGLQPGEIWYLAGPPGVGKTWLDLGVSMELGKSGPGAVISLEMKSMSVGRRLLSGLSGVSTRAMKSGYIQDGDPAKMLHAIEKFEKFPVWVDDSSYDTARLRSALVWAQREFGLKWFVLDYALLLMDRGRDENEQSKAISANLKRIVHDLNIAGLILHSVTKVGMDGGEPSQGDQRGSGQAIHDCDVQLFLTQLTQKDQDALFIKPEQAKKMATIFCTKGRELEESRFKLHLVRRGNSPFWAEYDTNPAHREPEYRERKDIDGD